MMTADDDIDLTLIERQGLAWVDLVTSGTATDGDVEAMKRWGTESPAHADALAAAVRQHRYAQAYKRPAEVVALAPHLMRRSGQINPSRRLFLGGAIAAGFGAVALFGPRAYRSLELMEADYQTRTGEHRNLQLALANVQMNSQSAIALETGGLKLITGEISVSTKAGQQMKVDTGSAAVMAQSADFNIRKTEADTCVICMAGQVAVMQSNKQGRVDLTAGQQVRYTSAGLQAPQPVNLEIATSWQRGEMVFRDTPLPEVVAEVNRYRQGQIILANQALAPQTFNGVFKIEHPEDALNQIISATGAKPVTLPGNLIILT